MLPVIDEFTHECLAIGMARRLNSQSVFAVLAELMVTRGVPDHIRSDNGPKFAARAVRDWIAKVVGKTHIIKPCSPWENVYDEKPNGKVRGELQSIVLFNNLRETKVLIERWRMRYDTKRPIGALSYCPLAAETTLSANLAYAM